MMSENEQIVIKEDQISRNWLSKKVLHSGINTIKKWWHLSLCAIIVAVIFMHFMGIPKRAWPLFLFLPSFPIILALTLIMVYPIFSMPQSWILNQSLIKARGIRFLGSIQWSSVYDWNIAHMVGLTHYYRLEFKWKKWKGVACGEHSILIPTLVQKKEVEAYFNQYCNR